MTVGERIRKFRGEKGMTQKELSEKAGVELSVLQKYERGACVLTRKTLERLASALGLDILHLMGAYGGTITLPPEEEDKVSHPAHYQGAFECIDEMVALFGVEAVKAFCRCNVYKYRYRADKKGGATDIAKAEWYMRKLMELEGTDCGLCKDEL